ncbi:group II intron reverse transcriptase/maturase [Rhizobium sp. L80/93]
MSPYKRVHKTAVDSRTGEEAPERVFTSLHHLIDLDWMFEAWALTRKDGAAGIDGRTADDYEKDLKANLESLRIRMMSGSYYAPPVRRHYIPKADGSRRPLGIPTFEDKVAQRAIVMLLEPIYEEDFLDCSFGFRPERSAHDAIRSLRDGIMDTGQRWVIDADISKYFDSIDHGHLRRFLDLRIRDGVIRRMIDKWLNAGVLEQGTLSRPVAGTPQGGVISPLLANIFLHYVLDKWFAEVAKPRLKRRCQMVRYADDFVMSFEDHLDGRRMLAVLGKRFERYGLRLHPDKTRYVDFRFRRPHGQHPATSATSSIFSASPMSRANQERQAGGAAGHGQGSSCAGLPGSQGMVHQASAPVAHGSASTPDPNDARPLRLLRDHGQRTTSDVVSPSGRAYLEKRALAPQPIWEAELESDGPGP